MRNTNKRALWAADCETDPFDGFTIPKPFIWGIYTGKDYYEFGATAELVAFAREQNALIYAHNGGKFDWHFLSSWFAPEDELLFIAGRLAKFMIGKCEFRDSFNLMPIALAQYQKTEFDYDKLNEAVRADHMEEIRDYLKSDCVNLWNLVNGFESEYGRHLTQASAAMKIWQRDYNGPAGKAPPRSNSGFYDTHKPYYYGGRVQCFENGDFKKSAMSIDINSAYPFAMLSDHPIGKRCAIRSGKPIKPLKKWGPMLIDIECTARGCFPYRATDGRLFYPADNVRRVYRVTGWEVIAAIETETIDPDWQIIRRTEFEDSVNFRDYVRHFWDKRQAFKKAGDKGGSEYCKIFLNALYGKFGADPRKYKHHSLISREDLLERIKVDGFQDLDYYPFREWMVLREPNKSDKQRFYNIATAASITGFVRAFLWRAICKADQPLYCDTDSICARSFPAGTVDLGADLGQWEIEGIYDRVVVAGKKLYAFHFSKDKRNGKEAGTWKTRSKGVKLNADEIIKVASGKTVKYAPLAPTFGARGTGPEFVSRMVRATARDITTVPRAIDPLFADSENVN